MKNTAAKNKSRAMVAAGAPRWPSSAAREGYVAAVWPYVAYMAPREGSVAAVIVN